MTRKEKQRHVNNGIVLDMILNIMIWLSNKSYDVVLIMET